MKLTIREREIVDLLLMGYGNAAISQKLGISQQTVKHHFSRMFLRFRIDNGCKRIKLAVMAYSERLS